MVLNYGTSLQEPKWRKLHSYVNSSTFFIIKDIPNKSVEDRFHLSVSM